MPKQYGLLKESPPSLEELTVASKLNIAHEIGELFMTARQERGLKIEDIAQVLYIRKFYIDAIEKGQFEVLPAGAYRWGFVKKYAEFLKLDSQEIYRRLVLTDTPLTIIDSKAFPSSLPQKKYVKLLWVGVPLALVAVTFFFIMRESSSGFQEAPPPPGPSPLQDESPEPAVVNLPTAPIAASTGSSALNQTFNPSFQLIPLTFRALQPTWIEIRDKQSELIIMKVLQIGENYTVPPQEGLTMNIGNAGGLEVRSNHKILPPLGKPGQVRNHIPLDDLRRYPIE